MRKIIVLAAVTILLCCQVPAFAEVMDKEPTLREAWITGLEYIVFCAVACRLLPWLAVLTLPCSFSLLGDLTDPSIGPAMLAEAGAGYVVQRYLVFAIAITVQLIAIALHRRSRRLRPAKQFAP